MVNQLRLTKSRTGLTRLNGYKKRKIGTTGIDTGNLFKNTAMSVSWIQNGAFDNALAWTIRAMREKHFVNDTSEGKRGHQ
jgi:hypothetical protein